MRRTQVVLLAVVVVLLSGCYHAVVDTGVEATPAASAETRTMWVNSWIAGLIAPPPVDAADHCGGRAASRVETQHTFLNQLVAMLTGGIYTPMTIEITCAAS